MPNPALPRPHVSLHRSHALFSRLRGPAAALALSLLIVLAGAPRAAADEPFDVSGPITDRASALNDEELVEVEQALDSFYDETGRQLFVVYVRGFDGLSGPEWAEATARESGLGSADILLAVSLGERSYGYSADADEFTEDELDTVDREYVLPRLRQDDWAGAAIAATEGLAEVTGSGIPWGWVLGGVVVVGIAGAVLVTRTRRRFDHSHRVVDEKGQPIDPADILTDDELEQRADSSLIAVDDALRTSAQELGFAQAQFGDDLTRTFAAVLDEGRERLREAFTLRQRLDDAEPETDEQRRELLSRIITLCDEVDTSLDEQVEHFDEARDLQGRAPEALAALEERLTRTRARLEGAERLWHELTQRHPTQVLASVHGNADHAARLLAEVAVQIGRVREALARDDRATAAVHLRAAEEATGQADALFDALETIREELQTARESSDDLLGRVASCVASVSTYVETHRGAVGTTARTRLSEAARLLREGGRSIETDPQAAGAALERADDLVQQAQSAAEADVAAWRAAADRQQEADRHAAGTRGRGGDGPGRGIGGAVGGGVGELLLGGILVDSVSRTRGRRRSPGSFGGSRTRARRSGGGRF